MQLWNGEVAGKKRIIDLIKISSYVKCFHPTFVSGLMMLFPCNHCSLDPPPMQVMELSWSTQCQVKYEKWWVHISPQRLFIAK